MKAMPTLEQYRAQRLSEGFDEVLERKWESNAVQESHTHPFSVRALVVHHLAHHHGQGEGFSAAHIRRLARKLAPATIEDLAGARCRSARWPTSSAPRARWKAWMTTGSRSRMALCRLSSGPP